MEVLPPPQTTSEVSAPTSRDAYTRRSRPSSVPASASFQRDFMRAHHITARTNVAGARSAPPLGSPAAPGPGRGGAPRGPGWGIRRARSGPVSQSAAAVVATRVTGGAGVRATAGVIAGRAMAGAMRAGDGDTVAAYGVAGRVFDAACACASEVGRSIHAVVSPVLRAVTAVRAMPIVASFQGFLSMTMSSVSA